MQFLPVLTTPAGLCLTRSNYFDVGVQCLSIYLDALIIRPGLSQLVAWCQQLQSEVRYVLNASNITFDAQWECMLISPMDGQRIIVTESVIMACLDALEPEFVIAPKNLSQSLKTYGLQTTENYHMIADLTPPQWRAMRHEAGYVESNAPAEHGRQGWFYGDDELLFLGESNRFNEMMPLRGSCACPTCSQGFTRAYLHHLWLQTPLLCQRYLIQHNLFVLHT